jgi:hypothetical protein
MCFILYRLWERKAAGRFKWQICLRSTPEDMGRRWRERRLRNAPAFNERQAPCSTSLLRAFPIALLSRPTSAQTRLVRFSWLATHDLIERAVYCVGAFIDFDLAGHLDEPLELFWIVRFRVCDVAFASSRTFRMSRHLATIAFLGRPSGDRQMTRGQSALWLPWIPAFANEPSRTVP